VDTEGLDRILGRRRDGAFRFADISRSRSADDGELAARYDETEAWDARFLLLNEEARQAFFTPRAVATGLDPNQEGYLETFVQSVSHVPAMVTRATRDLLVYAPALAPVLEVHPDVSGVDLDEAASWLTFELAGQGVSVWTPAYESSHAVAADAPEQLLDDLRAFVAATAE
jgi:hypothetical protein